MESGNHYVIQVKRNQPKLWGHLEEQLRGLAPTDEFMATERSKGSLHTWLAQVYDLPSEPPGWKNARRLVCVGKVTGEGRPCLRLFVSDLAMTDAERYYRGIRGHWAIENGLHWPKDVYHGEDDNGIRHPNGAVNCSLIGTIALNVHRKNGRKKIKQAQMVANANLRQMIEEIRT